MLKKHQQLAEQLAAALKTAKDIEADGGSVQTVINDLRDIAQLVDLRVKNYSETSKSEK